MLFFLSNKCYINLNKRRNHIREFIASVTYRIYDSKYHNSQGLLRTNDITFFSPNKCCIYVTLLSIWVYDKRVLLLREKYFQKLIKRYYFTIMFSSVLIAHKKLKKKRSYTRLAQTHINAHLPHQPPRTYLFSARWSISYDSSHRCVTKGVSFAQDYELNISTHANTNRQWSVWRLNGQ